jgi:ribosomal protein L7/L12
MLVSRGAAMGRPKGRVSERDDVTVKLDRAIVGKAKAIALHRGITVAELLSDAAKPVIDKAYAAMLRELEAGEE